MEIYLLRHAIAENAKPGQADSQRALTGEGREKLSRVMKRAGAAGVKPAVILSSPYRRALETAAIAAETLEYHGEIERTSALEPSASPPDVWEEIRARKSETALLLSSHEPLMSGLAAFLLSCPALDIDMKKAALVRVDCDRFGPQPKGVLKWMITPALAGE
jgi:phosphohistidine phosphatase